MAFLEHKLNLKVQQKQVLTPSLVQMVNLLALNKLELTDMIQQELVAESCPGGRYRDCRRARARCRGRLI